MVHDKYRIRFRKVGDLRFISHHDLMRCFERMLRRAQLPFHSTSGFNPKPRLIFASPLPLGISGAAEVAELELDSSLDPEAIQERLSAQSPAGLEILSVQRIDGRTTAHVQSVRYRLPLGPAELDGLSVRAAALLESKESWIERTRPELRRIDIRPYLKDIRIVADGVQIDLLVTPNGTARPDEIVRLLGIEDALGRHAPLERISIELEDEWNVASTNTKGNA
jgi:radical SAM-linked protein